MTKDNQKWVEEMVNHYNLNQGAVLDVGSLDVNGEVRQYFDKAEFTGVDMRAGKGVDIVLRGDRLMSEFDPHQFDTVLCLNTLEHDSKFWETLDQMKIILKPQGHLVIITPTINFPIHDHPADYWRFTEQAYKDVLFGGFEILNLEPQFTKTDDNGKGINPVICCIGKKI